MPSKPKSPKSRLQKTRLFFWRWHRRIGVSAALVVVLASFTGILLNHTSELELGKSPVRQDWLLEYYGVELPALINFSAGEQWVSGDDNQYLYLDGHQFAYCNGRLIGVAETDGLLVAACTEELILMTRAGEVVERLGSTYGLPVPLAAVGSCGAALCLRSQEKNWVADFQQLVWQPTEQITTWSTPVAMPSALRELVLDEQLGSDLSWERVVQDLHSGRILGRWGVWVVDLAALFLVFLSLSGFFLWYQQYRRRR